MEITIPYYEDNSRVSNSAIGWFLKYGPKYLRDKLDGKIPDEKSAAMGRGTMIHMYLLQPEEFRGTYQIFNGLVPKSENQKKFCEEVVNSLELEPNKALLSAYKASYKVTTQNDDLTLSKAQELASTYSQYIAVLKAKLDKIQINQYDANMLSTIGQNVADHKLAHKLLHPDEGENHHEFHINWDWKVADRQLVPCKSLIDCCTFDKEHKVCTLVDIKTTVHIGCFEESVNQYDYTRQLYFYKCALMWYIENELHEQPEDWQFKYYIIAIDTTGRYNVRVFELTEDQLKHNQHILEDVFTRLQYHIRNNVWDYNVEYYTSNGAEKLNLND